tara:strand:- start:4849 stop:5607 length:759 start_codon:yes stop_codon:yes gene_type:complete
MSQAQIIVWEPSNGNTDTIASVQALAGAGNLVLNTNTLPNNTLAFPTTTNPFGSYIYNGVARAVLISSGANLSALDVTITGLGSAVDGVGNPTGPILDTYSETISGPNNDIVETLGVFTRIDSISINGAAANISAGFGTYGITHYLFPDYDRKAWYASCSAQVFASASLLYSGYVSLNKPSYPSLAGYGNIIPFVGGEIPAFPIATNMTGASNNQIAQLNYPIATIWWRIEDNAVLNADEKAIFTFLQQGIT